jgi:hypothetical protein
VGLLVSDHKLDKLGRAERWWCWLDFKIGLVRGGFSFWYLLKTRRTERVVKNEARGGRWRWGKSSRKISQIG